MAQPALGVAAERVYDELLDFIAGGATTEAVANYQCSERVHQRVYKLLERQKDGGLSVEEQREVELFDDIEFVLSMAKARAQQLLTARAH